MIPWRNRIPTRWCTRTWTKTATSSPTATAARGTHTRTHTQTKAVINRLARAIGHLESVKRMVEDGRDCAEVLIQLAAVRSALNNTAKIILKDHIDHCLADAVETGDQQAIDELNQAIEKFMN